MITSLIQIDNFAPDAIEVRKAVIDGGFSEQTGPDGLPYKGISMYEVPKWFDLLTEALGRRIIPRISCFRLNLAGELPHSWVHSDEVCGAQQAAVLYLNLPSQCQGGTAFWKNAALGLDYLPAKETLEAQGVDPKEFYLAMNKEWHELLRWEQVSLIGMRFNRFITYPTCLFHSRYPFGAFGNGPEDGRLIWAAFYDVE